MKEVRLVFLAANPLTKPPLQLAEELSAIRVNVERTSARDKVGIYPYFAARPDNLRGALEIHRPHILHFCGFHQDGGILLEDANRQPAPFSPRSLAALFKDYSHNVKLVFLNTCFVEKSATGLSKYVDAVVAFSGYNQDACAISFAGKFYGKLARGYSVQQAFDQAKTVYFENNIDPSWHPRIWTKRGSPQEEREPLSPSCSPYSHLSDSRSALRSDKQSLSQSRSSPLPRLKVGASKFGEPTRLKLLAVLKRGCSFRSRVNYRAKGKNGELSTSKSSKGKE